MATNSKREAIIIANKNILESISSIQTVKREMPTYEGLQSHAVTQFPISVIIGRLPVPVEKRTGRDGSVVQVISELKIDIITYFLNSTSPDVQVSSMMDDMWAALYADQKRGNLVLSTEIEPSDEVGYWDPYVAFKLTVKHKYVHNQGGI